MDVRREGHEHLDEGMIHAWLDGALGADVAAEVEARAAGCDECSARVAEARGLIAGSSRVVGALDDVPSDAPPSWGRAPVTPTASGSLWRVLRVTPARAAIAATILVGVGITLTRDRSAEDRPSVPQVLEQPAASGAAAAPAPRMQDSVLSSAIARSMADASPPRSVKAAPGIAVPVPAVAEPSPAATEMMRAADQVAVGKAAATAQRDTSGVRADKLAVPGAAAFAPMAARASAPVSPPRCYRIESEGARSWALGDIPFVVTMESRAGAAVAHLPGASGSWREAPGDSLRIEVRRDGEVATISLAPGGAVRAGLARSGDESVRVTGVSVGCAGR